MCPLMRPPILGSSPAWTLLRPAPPLDARTCMATLQLSARSTKMGLSRYPMALRPPSSCNPNGTAFLLDEETSILIPTGTSSPPPEDAGDIKYDNA